MVALAEGRGCPSGLEPTRAPDAGPDPSAFVSSDRAGAYRLELLVTGARCAACIRKIESGFLALPGVHDARLNLTTGRLTITWAGEPSRARQFTHTLADLGYDAVAFDPAASVHARDEEGRALLRRLAVAGFAAMNIMMFSVPIWGGTDIGPATRALLYWLSAIIAIPAALYAGQPFFRSAFAALRRRRANMDVPISLAVILTLAMSLYETAAGGGHAYFDGVVMLLFLLLIGRYLDHRLREKARTAARDLLALQAITAARIDADGALRSIPVRDIAIGDRLSLSPGARAPVDGVVETGVSEIDRSLLTGETRPVAVRPGDAIHAGTVNITRALVMRATRTLEDSTLSELARLIELGEQKRAQRMRLIERAAALYVPIVHTLAALTLAGWLIVGADLHHALTAAIAVLIITCPCALGLAAPAVQIVATGRLFKQGVFVKSGDALERLALADYAVLDKTGTLTLGEPVLISSLDRRTLDIAASLARTSRHPLSRALVHAAGPGAPAHSVIEHPGRGLEASIEGRRVRLGSRAFVAPERDGETHDGAELWLQIGAGAPIQMQFQDALRIDAPDAVRALEARGLTVELLSGDRPAAVESAARSAGVRVWRGAASPKDKTDRLAALSATGKRVLMVGDGLNDAAALAAAHVSASPGAAIDATQAAADLVFRGARLSPLIEAIDVARAARRRIAENLAFSALYNAAAIPVAVFGLVTPLIAAIAMSASSLVVTLNALRLAKGSPR